MDVALTPSQRAFKESVATFFATEYPQDILRKMREGVSLSRADHVRAQQALNARGWLGVSWPEALGGTGWTEFERYLFEAELERIGAPDVIPMSIHYIGPIICAFGTDEQKAKWLPDILESRAMWAQGYSEPESGSDLASLRMTAVRDGDDYILNGSKIWTSYAHWADWIFCLVRTSKEERKQAGITMLCAEMTTPGISVHPIISIDGAHSLNRVDFDEVRVPARYRIGDEGRGWHYANVLLAAERLSLSHIGRKKAMLAEMRRIAGQTRSGPGKTVLDEPGFASRLAALEIEVAVLEISVLRAINNGHDAASVSSLKISCTEAAQRLSELAVELAGRASHPAIPRKELGWASRYPDLFGWGVPAMATYLSDRAQTLYGGTTEVQKNILWRQIQKSAAALG